MIREKLLATGTVVENEYFEKYINLITNPQNSTNENIVIETHHIIPVSYFKHAGKDIDNSEDNLIDLDIKNHVLAHYYLALCSALPWFYYGNATCVNLLTKRAFSSITEEWIQANLTEINSIKQYRLYLNSALQIGLQAGEKNPNNKYSFELCEQIKFLLTSGKQNKEISQQLNIPDYLINRIREGNHWSCANDRFSFSKAETKQLLEKQKIALWLTTNPICKNCGKPIVIYIKSKNGDGCFCSKHCALSFSAKERFFMHPEIKEKIVANRDYSGSKNPNYGKKASKETRQKISIGVKKSGGSIRSSKFAGHKHSESSKQKISEALKLVHLRKKTNSENNRVLKEE